MIWYTRSQQNNYYNLNVKKKILTIMDDLDNSLQNLSKNILHVSTSNFFKHKQHNTNTHMQ